MSELWVPTDDDYVDPADIFQMASELQHNLQEIRDFEQLDEFKLFALSTLTEHIKRSTYDSKEYVVDSSIAILEDRTQAPIAAIENASFYGLVSAANILEGGNYPLGLAIRMDALSMTSLDQPYNTDPMSNIVNMPVAGITYARAA